MTNVYESINNIDMNIENIDVDEIFTEDVIDRSRERILRGIKNETTGYTAGDETTETSSDIHPDKETEVYSYALSRIIASVSENMSLINKLAESEARSIINRRVRDEDISDILYDMGVEHEVKEHREIIEDSYIGDQIEKNYGVVKDRFIIENIEEKPSSNIIKKVKRQSNFPRRKWYLVDLDEYLLEDYMTNPIVELPVKDGKVRLSMKKAKDFIIDWFKLGYTEDMPMNVNDVIEKKVRDTGVIEDIKSEMSGSFDQIDFKDVSIQKDCFPPVMKKFMKQASEQKPMNHMDRFDLTAFLLQIGMSEEELVEFYSEGLEDYIRETTEYQVNHINTSGEDGGAYMPSSYDGIESRGVEWDKDKLEESVNNPLAYYAIKLEEKLENEESHEEES